jgi:hypothetical protein
MLIQAKSLNGYNLQSIDKKIGNVKEFYFDDHYWTIRYIVADTGNWLTGRQVLISPYALESVNKAKQYIAVGLTKRQIEGSPSLNNNRPVSRQFEENYYRYYRWPMYWDGKFMWGYFPTIERDREKWKKSYQGEGAWDFQLRSTHEVNNCNIKAVDGEIGHIEDFVIDDETWAIRYLIVNTRNSGPGKKVLISTKWIDFVIWNESGVVLNLSSNAVRQSPEYTGESLLTRDYETRLHRHYNRRGYWIDEPAANDSSTMVDKYKIETPSMRDLMYSAIRDMRSTEAVKLYFLSLKNWISSWTLILIEKGKMRNGNKNFFPETTSQGKRQ